jgi:hypothetical protein
VKALDYVIYGFAVVAVLLPVAAALAGFESARQRRRARQLVAMTRQRLGSEGINVQAPEPTLEDFKGLSLADIVSQPQVWRRVVDLREYLAIHLQADPPPK